MASSMTAATRGRGAWWRRADARRMASRVRSTVRVWQATQKRTRSSESERGGQVAHPSAHAGQRLEIEPTGDELQDRGRVVAGVVDEAAPGEGRDDDGGDAGGRSPAVAGGRRHVVPEAAVLVVGYDDRRALPGGARLDAAHDVGDVPVARQDRGVARMLVEAALGLVEDDLGQGAGIDVRQQLVQVLQMIGA